MVYLDSHFLQDSKIINDVIHGHFALSVLAVMIIDTREFFRLRFLKQLGPVNFVFPCATHTRFEHSLGVYYLAKKYMTILSNHTPISPTEIELVAIGGLLHDIGHGMLSHTFEKYAKMVGQPFHHEKYSLEIISRLLTRILGDSKNSLESQCDINEIIDFVKNVVEPTDHQFKFSIVCNKITGIDVDKMDYLLRDSFYTNKPSGFEYNRFMLNTRVIDDKLCYANSEIYNVYELFRMRASMFAQVYIHKAVLGIELLILDMLKYSNFPIPSTLDEYLEIDDTNFQILLKDETNVFAKRLVDRNLYKCIHKESSTDLSYLTEESNKWENDNHRFDEDRSSLRGKDDRYIVKIIPINYGMSDNNPIDHVQFYDHNGVASFLKNDYTHNILLPTIFNEYTFYVYDKS